MQVWTIAELAHSAGGVLHGSEIIRDVPVGGFSIDTRTVQPGDVFLALQGSQLHGIEMWKHAVEAGARVIIVGNDAPEHVVLDVHEACGDELALITVDKPGIEMVGVVGQAWRRRAGFTVIGITGSSGKTSCKELLRGIMSRRFTVAASPANHNNELGVPLTLLQAPRGTDVVICEMGMRGLGQIAYLCDIAEPDIGIITTIGTAHLELLKTEANIARAKAEIIAGVGSGTAVIPADRMDLVTYAGTEPGTMMAFAGYGATGPADIVVSEVQRTAVGIAGKLTSVEAGSFPFEVPFHGAHNASNLAAACCAMRAAGATWDDIRSAVQVGGVRWPGAVAGRGDRHQLATHGLLINDAYNANPESVRAALDELAATEALGGRVAVLGYMAELGVRSPEFHAAIGAYAAARAIDQLVLIHTHPDVAAIAREWTAVRGVAPREYNSTTELVDDVSSWAPGADGVVMVKASNSVGLGRAVDEIVERYGTMVAHLSGSDVSSQ